MKYSVSLQNPPIVSNINNLFNQSTCNQIQLHHSISSNSEIINPNQHEDIIDRQQRYNNAYKVNQSYINVNASFMT